MGKLLSSDDLDMTIRSELDFPRRARTQWFDDAHECADDDYDDDDFEGEVARMIQLDGMISVEWGDVESVSLD